MAGLGVYARKTWKKFRDDSDRAKAEKKRKENEDAKSPGEKKISQWRKDREKEERRKYVSDFDPIDESIKTSSSDRNEPINKYPTRPRNFRSVVNKSTGKVEKFEEPIDLRSDKYDKNLENKKSKAWKRKIEATVQTKVAGSPFKPSPSTYKVEKK